MRKRPEVDVAAGGDDLIILNTTGVGRRASVHDKIVGTGVCTLVACQVDEDLCLFRRDLVGERRGKRLVLAQHLGERDDHAQAHAIGIVLGQVVQEGRHVFRLAAGKRLARGLLTVVDATNVQPESRRSLVALAREHDVLPVAIVLDLPPRLCIERNAARPFFLYPCATKNL